MRLCEGATEPQITAFRALENVSIWLWLINPCIWLGGADTSRLQTSHETPAKDVSCTSDIKYFGNGTSRIIVWSLPKGHIADSQSVSTRTPGTFLIMFPFMWLGLKMGCPFQN